MRHQLIELPYAKEALKGYMSEQTLDFHHGKHHQAYVNNLNKLIEGTEFENKSLEEIIKTAPDGGIYNNAAQTFNHTMFFMQLTGKPDKCCPSGKLGELIDRDFKSFDQFKEEFSKAAATVFGSGWAFLAIDKNDKLHIVKESNAGNPLRNGMKPLMCFDVWEHAYYLDYQNRRPDFIAKLWEILDWKVIEKRL